VAAGISGGQRTAASTAAPGGRGPDERRAVSGLRMAGELAPPQTAGRGGGGSGPRRRVRARTAPSTPAGGYLRGGERDDRHRLPSPRVDGAGAPASTLRPRLCASLRRLGGI